MSAKCISIKKKKKKKGTTPIKKKPWGGIGKACKEKKEKSSRAVIGKKANEWENGIRYRHVSPSQKGGENQKIK